MAEEIRGLEDRSRQAQQVHDYLQTQPPLTYTPDVWSTLVAEVKVNADGTISVIFEEEV